MKKKHFRLTLTEYANSVTKDTVLYAAFLNSKTNPMENIKSIADFGERLCTVNNDRETKFELVGETKLYIDVKVGDHYENAAIIEEIEILETVYNEEEAEAEMIE